MKFEKDTSGVERYVAFDIHKEYGLVGGQNAQQKWVMPPRRVGLEKFREVQWKLVSLEPDLDGEQQGDARHAGDFARQGHLDRRSKRQAATGEPLLRIGMRLAAVDAPSDESRRDLIDDSRA